MSSLDESSLGPSSEFQENLNLLRQTHFFSGLPLESLKIFAYLCVRERLHAGEFLFRQGENDQQAYYIVSGRARLERSENEREIREFGAGVFIGGLTLLGETRRLYSLRAVEETVCILLSRDKFTKAIQQFPEQLPRIIRVVVRSINDWEDRFLGELAVDCGACLPHLGVSLL
jgi:CRP/FNR family cyclic AMP-dependent transcriptional regulator